MNGKILAIFFVLALIIAGPGLYYLQVYHYYREVPAADAPQSLSAPGVDRQAVSLPVRDYKGIYSVSTPIGHRACFTTDAATAQTVAPYPAATPLGAPGWFDCFDYGAITEDLEAGRATAHLVQKNIAPKIDAVIAVYPDGRAYEWRQANEEAEEKRTIE